MSLLTRLAAVCACLVVAASLAGGGGATPGQNAKLSATVGPGFTITLQDASGARVTTLDPGTYDIEVQDLSDMHNFHLTGPGVNRTTEIAETGTFNWTVTFTDGAYRYVCDPHVAAQNGSFTVGNVATTPTPPVGPVTSKTKLQLNSGPGFTIALKTSAGKAVTSMKTGTYTVVVRDRSPIHNAHLVAPGYNRLTTPLSYTGTQTWKVKLAKAGTLRFLCDPHVQQKMRGSAKIVP